MSFLIDSLTSVRTRKEQNLGRGEGWGTLDVQTKGEKRHVAVVEDKPAGGRVLGNLGRQLQFAEQLVLPVAVLGRRQRPRRQNVLRRQHQVSAQVEPERRAKINQANLIKLGKLR